MSNKVNLQEIDFSTAVPKCSETQVSKDLVELLALAQSMCGTKFRINCGFRSEEWDISKGRVDKNGKPYSSHCKGLAVDISTPDSKTRYLVLVSCVLAGFRRVGLGKNFIHVDIDNTKSSPCLWHYYE